MTIDDFSPADFVALRVLTDVVMANNKMVVDLARTVASERGIRLSEPQPAQPEDAAGIPMAASPSTRQVI